MADFIDSVELAEPSLAAPKSTILKTGPAIAKRDPAAKSRKSTNRICPDVSFMRMMLANAPAIVENASEGCEKAQFSSWHGPPARAILLRTGRRPVSQVNGNAFPHTL